MTEFGNRVRGVLGLYQSRSRDSDIEQAWLRIGICSLAFLYVWYLIASEGQITSGLWMGLVASLGDIAVAGLMIWQLRRDRTRVVPLRYLGIIADNTALTIGMAGAGEGGVAMIGVYLWVTIGNGFRFGPRFLLAAYWLSIVGFGLQLVFVPFWEQHRVVGVGLFLAGAIVPLYVLVLLIRLTGQKEAAEQLSNAKSRFVANVSHELRTPLTGVFAVYDLLRRKHLGTDNQELVGMLGNAVRTLKASVDAVLQMSKLEAGAERAEKKRFNLWFVLQQLGATVRPQAEMKGLSWSLSIDENVPYNMVGDPSHLGHVLGNLLNNAFKFTSAGFVSLTVCRPANGTLQLAITDSGIGIPKDQQERLFERFVQVDGSARRKFGGTGLGTSIARDLTELMGGTIAVESVPGKGSTFTVRLPFEAEYQEEGLPEWGIWQDVLLISDDTAELRSVVCLLKDLGLNASILSPREFDVRDIDSRKFLAAIILMPAESALAYLSRYLRDQAGAICPCVVLSSKLSRQEHQELIRSGAVALEDRVPSIDVLTEVLLPLAQRLDVASQNIDQEVRSPLNNATKRLSVLLADDNASNRMLISRVLEHAGHRVYQACRGDEAFDLMTITKLDVAILDLNMPDMSGPDIVKLFRAGSVGATHLPIVILSADATPAAKKESLEAGADEYLTKPVTSQSLLMSLDRLVGIGVASLATPTLPVVSSSVSSPPAPSQLIDTDQIQSLRRISRGDRTFLDQYVTAAFGELEQAIADLRQAAATGAIADARSALHIIEGTGGSIGASALVASCKSMRNYISLSPDPDRNQALAELSTILALSKSAVLAIISGAQKQPSSRIQ